MSKELKDRRTVELKAEFDSNTKQILSLIESNEALGAELSARSNALTFVRNQVIAGEKASLLANGVSPAAVEEAETWVAEWKEMKRLRREAAIAPEAASESNGGAS